MNAGDDTETEELFYVYCFTGTMPVQHILRGKGRKIHVIPGSGIYAIASRVSQSEFGKVNLEKGLSDMKWLEAKVLEHHAVIEELSGNCTVIPFKFATLFENEANVRAFLEKHGGEFSELLEQLTGKEEWGVKVYCDVHHLKAILREENEGIKKIERDINASSTGEKYFLQKKEDKVMDDILNRVINECSRDSFETLREQSHDACIGKLLPREITKRKEEMILNAVFLIDKTKLVEFENCLRHLREKYTPKGLAFDCTGPWPPYNFCSIKKEDAV